MVFRQASNTVSTESKSFAKCSPLKMSTKVLHDRVGLYKAEKNDLMGDVFKAAAERTRGKELLYCACTHIYMRICTV